MNFVHFFFRMTCIKTIYCLYVRLLNCYYQMLTVAGSLMTEAVRPAAELPFPEVYTAIGDTFCTNFSN